MGAALTQAESWLAKRRQDLPVVDRDFIDQGTQRERKARIRTRRVQALVYVLLVGIILGLIGVIDEAYVKVQWNWYPDHASLQGCECGPLCAQARGRAGADPGRRFPGMRQGLSLDGRRACGRVHDGVACQ